MLLSVLMRERTSLQRSSSTNDGKLYWSILRILCDPELDHWNVNVDKLPQNIQILKSGVVPIVLKIWGPD